MCYFHREIYSSKNRPKSKKIHRRMACQNLSFFRNASLASAVISMTGPRFISPAVSAMTFKTRGLNSTPSTSLHWTRKTGSSSGQSETFHTLGFR